MGKCGKATEVFSRVTGYHRPVKNWNKGKQEEFKERKTYETLSTQSSVRKESVA